MKKPVKPIEPKKPEEPSKTIKIPHRISILDDISLEKLLSEVPKDIPQSDINIIREEDWNYDGREMTTSVYLIYHVEKENPYYDAEVKRFSKRMDQYGFRMSKYNPLLETYMKEYKVWEEWNNKEMIERRETEKQKEIIELEKRLKKLKKIIKNEL